MSFVVLPRASPLWTARPDKPSLNIRQSRVLDKRVLRGPSPLTRSSAGDGASDPPNPKTADGNLPRP